MTGTVEFGVGFGGTLPPSDYGPLARALEDYGFDVVTAFGDLMMQPPAMIIGEMARATSRLRLGIGCYTPWTLHPVEIAGQIAYLDALSHGRVFMGIVRGAWLDQLGIDTSRAFAAIKDTLAIVDIVLSGDGRGHTGSMYSIEPNTLPYYPIHRSRVPLMVGTWSPRLAEFAGEHADEIQVGGCANPAMISPIHSWAVRGQERAGRAADSVKIVLTAVTVVDDDGPAARSQARTQAALPLHAIARLDRTIDVDPGLLDRMGKLLRENDHRAAGALISDDLLDKFSFSGTPNEVIEHAAAVYEAGATRIEFDSPFGLTARRGIDLLGTRVLPALRSYGFGR